MRESLQVLLSITAHPDAETRSERLLALIESGFSPEDFEGYFPEKEIFDRVIDSYQRFHSVPSATVLLNEIEMETGERLPIGTVDVSEASFQHWLKGFRRAKLRFIAHQTSVLLHEMASTGCVEDMPELIEHVSKEILSLSDSRRPKPLLPFMEEAIERHEELRTKVAEPGIPLGFPYIDAVTGGIQPGDMVVIAGKSGSGKTYILCKSSEHAARKQGKRVMFVTMEMTGLQIGRRIAALGAGVNATKFRLGKLDAFALDQVRDYVESWKTKDADNFIVLDDIMQMSTSDIALRVQEYRPDVVYVDGLYMLKPSSGPEGKKRWEQVMESVEELKQLALTQNIPIIATTQYARKGSKDGMEGIGYSYAIAQVASIVLSIEDSDGEASAFQNETSKVLKIIKGREGEHGSIRLRYDMRRSIIEQDAVLEGDYEAVEASYANEKGGEEDDDLVL